MPPQEGGGGPPVTAQPGQYQPMLPQGGDQPQFSAPVQGPEGAVETEMKKYYYTDREGER